jgi:hypothetical protein
MTTMTAYGWIINSNNNRMINGASINTDDEVVFVHNTPRQPPPLLEPPPSILDNSDDNDDIDLAFNSVPSIDGECILLFRSAYQVDRMYQVDTILSAIVLLLLHSGSVAHYQVVNDRYSYSNTTIDGELILLFRLAYRVDRLSSIVSLLQSGSVHDDTIAISLLEALYQVKYEMIQSFQLMNHDDGDTTTTMQLEVPYQDKYHNTAVVSSLDRNGEWILLFRSEYQVDRMYRVATVLSSIVLLLRSQSGLILLYRLAYRVDKILSSIVLLLRSQSVHEDDTIAIKQLVVLYQDINGKRYEMIRLGLFRLAYRVNRMYRVDTILSSIVLLLQSQSVLTLLFRFAYRVVLYQDKCVSSLDMTSSATQNGEISLATQNGECNAEEYHCYNNELTILITTSPNGEYVIKKEERPKEKYQLRALRSEGQYKDEVYNAEEGMFQEPILRLDYYLVIIFMYSFSRTSIGDGDETTTLISTTQTGKNKKIEEKEEGLKEPVPSFLMVQMCLCLCFCTSIVTLNILVGVHNVLGQSMGSVKIHKDQVNRASQTRARLEARLESNCEPSNPAYRVTCLYVLPYLSLYVLSYLRKTPL